MGTPNLESFADAQMRYRSGAVDQANTLTNMQMQRQHMQLQQQQLRQLQQTQSEMEQLKPILAQVGGDPRKAIQALLATGNPTAIALAGKLHALVPQIKEEMVVAPGSTVLDRNRNPIYTAPQAQGSQPEIIKLTNMMDQLPEGHPRRDLLAGRIAQLSGQRTSESPLAKLIAERDALPDGHPMKATYDEAIKHQTNPQAQRIIMPPQPRNLQLTTDAEGNQLIVNPDGTTRPLTTESGTGVKKPIGADKPMTEVQGKAAMYGTRAAQSDKVLKSIEDKISTTGLAAARAIPGGNFLMSSDQRRVDQAQRDFVNAVLRQESGAAIAQSEFDNAKLQYFPAPGDDPKTVAQKRANRQLAVRGFIRMAGPKGAPDIQAVIDEPLLPGVAAITPTPQQAGMSITDKADAILRRRR